MKLVPVPEPPPDAPPRSRREVDVLVVDDRVEDLLALESVLATSDYNVVTARSGREALLKVLRQDFAVILLDAHMPGMDGFEVATIIKQRERSRHTPILFLTADTTGLESIYKAYQIGAIDYLIKPIDRDVVRAKVAVFVELFRKDQRIREQAEQLRLAERRQRELELERERLASQRRYRNLADAIPQIVVLTAPDGALTSVNRHWTTYTGMSYPQALGWGWTAAVHPDELESQLAHLGPAMTRGEGYETECRLRRADGSYRWHKVIAVPEHDDAGVLTGWIASCTDIDDLKQANARAREAIDLRDEFLSIASHELRTPLSAMLLGLESMRLDVERGADHARLGARLDRNLRQTVRLTKLVGNLLDVSRIVSGRLELELDECDAAEVAREVVDRHAEEAERAGCTVEVVTAPAPGRWDRLRLEQVVTNLLANAIKYAAGAPIAVRVRGGERVQLEVEDRGPGIGPADLERIFGRFERAAPTRHFGGLGIGLFIAQQIIAAHGGEIAGVSAPGAGARFTVELPGTISD